MTHQPQIIAAIDEQIPLADLYRPAINPRAIVNDDSIAALAINIREHGLIPSPAGSRDISCKVGIVTGVQGNTICERRDPPDENIAESDPGVPVGFRIYHVRK